MCETGENKNAPFNLSEVEDVKIIIKANNKHYSILGNEICTKEFARELRIGLLSVVLEYHSVVDTALEDVRSTITAQPVLISKKELKSLNDAIEQIHADSFCWKDIDIVKDLKSMEEKIKQFLMSNV